jgi:hypothetical protein
MKREADLRLSRVATACALSIIIRRWKRQRTVPQRRQTGSFAIGERYGNSDVRLDAGVVEWVEHNEISISEADDGFANARPIPGSVVS